MNLKEAMQFIDQGWKRRLKGFRVHFERWDGTQWIPDHFPDPGSKPITSEVSAWELARRFAQATRPDQAPIRPGNTANVHVVDDLGNPVLFYGTHAPLGFNKKKDLPGSAG